MPATGSIQKLSAFRRGKAMSCAPIMIGMTKLPRPANAGITNRKIMSAACTENSPLNVPGEKYCWPGVASSARMPSASMPPIMKKMKVVTRYWTPITLWSVLTLK